MQLQGQTIATIREALTEGQISNAEVIAELDARHVRAVAKGKGSRFPARRLYAELTGKELPGTKLVEKAIKAEAEPQKRSDAIKACASGTLPKAATHEELVAKYLQRAHLIPQMLKRTQDPSKLAAMQEALNRSKQPKAAGKAKGSALEAAKAALSNLSDSDKGELAALFGKLK